MLPNRRVHDTSEETSEMAAIFAPNLEEQKQAAFASLKSARSCAKASVCPFLSRWLSSLSFCLSLVWGMQ